MFVLVVVVVVVSCLADDILQKNYISGLQMSGSLLKS